MLALTLDCERVYGFSMEERVAALDAVFQPIEPPTTCARSMPRPSSTATASATARAWE